MTEATNWWILTAIVLGLLLCAGAVIGLYLGRRKRVRQNDDTYPMW